MRYRRVGRLGGTYFFTLVTFNRKKILCIPENVELLRHVFRQVMASHPFAIDALVLLPDHLHCIWTLPQGDADFSGRWRLIKSYFSRNCKSQLVSALTESMQKKQEKAVWQRRFWEHLIRDDEDFEKHVEYIHFNPVKHCLAEAPKEWKYSSFHQYVRKGIYELNWGAGIEMAFDPNVGCE